MKSGIDIARAYDLPARPSGVRFLIDRLWPRGIRKEDLPVDGWLKDVAPSTALRQWFGHDPARWTVFRKRYEVELTAHPEAWQPILEAARKDTVTLVYAAKDPEHNHAQVLRGFLKRRLSPSAGGRRSSRAEPRARPSRRRGG
jgi:uncharacterized protein YeaO (DUF488 family)